MSGDCGVCIGGFDADGPSEFCSVRFPKARKAFHCSECGREIVGVIYEYCATKFDGDFNATKTCMECRAIAIGFTCEGVRIIGELWADMQESVFPNMNYSCFARVEGVAAKSYLRERWMQWKGLAK